ncbi:hypothetical protein AB4305_27750 [Nocardia sp. 2YAB30]|uniref:hypothetical protein n=1 Tax=unclassified Nocardia TaxID=2637762 RepID=UPI003F995ABB
MAAAVALARGVDSPALRELAGIHRSDCRDAPHVFLTALVELGLADVSEVDWSSRQARVLLGRARQHATRLLTGIGEPGEVSEDIASLLHRLAHAPEPLDAALHDLATDFEVLNVDWEEGYDDRAVVIDRLRQAAQYLLDGPPYNSVIC